MSSVDMCWLMLRSALVKAASRLRFAVSSARYESDFIIYRNLCPVAKNRVNIWYTFNGSKSSRLIGWTGRYRPGKDLVRQALPRSRVSPTGQRAAARVGTLCWDLPMVDNRQEWVT